jgi:hypothetical protein
MYSSALTLRLRASLRHAFGLVEALSEWRDSLAALSPASASQRKTVIVLLKQCLTSVQDWITTANSRVAYQHARQRP